MGVVAKRFDVFLVNLDPTIGREIEKTRPCVIISPDEMNLNISTVIVAPMMTKGCAYPTRVPCRFKRRNAYVVLDQIQTVDKQRLVRGLGKLPSAARLKALDVLAEMFAP